MKFFKRFLKFLFVILVLLAIAGWLFIQHLKPDYEGKLSMPSLEHEVEVNYDTYGIPHIYAETEADAYRALGYVHAQDRLWQMEVLRRIPKGQLSEIFGKEQLKTDKFFLSLGIDEASVRTVANLDTNSDSFKMAEAYLSGVNHFIETGPKPIEFYLLGIDKQKFDLVDVHDIIGYMAFTFAQAHKTDPLLTTIQQKLGKEYLSDLAIAVDTNTTYIKNFTVEKDSTLMVLNAEVTEALNQLPVPQLEGSNSWVLSPAITKNGKVILANDPHIGFAQPSVWYEAHLSTPSYEMYGYHLGGVPFPLLSHNKYRANGLTMFQNDDLDFYWEERNPENAEEYKTEIGWRRFETRTKTIKIKGEEDVTVTYEATRHGTLLNGIAEQVQFSRPVAADWVFTKEKNELLDALYGMSKAKDIENFQRHVARIHAPGLNVMYGDAKGNIAWFAAGKLYEMPDSTNTKFIMDGISGKHEKERFLDFSYNPKAINPDWNYVYSANNRTYNTEGETVTGYYLPENRARRIVALLDEDRKWDVDANKAMINDVTSAVVPELIQELSAILEGEDLDASARQKLDLLKTWKGNYDTDEVAPSLYHRWEYLVVKYAFEDEMGEALFTQFLKTHIFKKTIAKVIAAKNSVWWDDVSTETKETQGDILKKALYDAIAELEEEFGTDHTQWTWNKLHTLEHGHPIGKVNTLRGLFNVGPFPINGGREVINNLAFKYDDHDDHFQVSSGPSTRRIIDYSDVANNSWSILPTGQSGNPFSPHYDDQAELYVKGAFRKMLLDTEEIKNSSQEVLTLLPN